MPLFTPSVSTHPGYISGNYYLPIGKVSFGTSTATAATTAYFNLAYIGGIAPVKLSELGIRIFTVGTTNIQLAVYANDTSSGISRPGAFIGKTADIVNTSAAIVSGAVTGTPTINPGWYWFALQSNDTSVRYQTVVGNSTDQSTVMYQGTPTLANVMSSTTVNGVSSSTGVSAYGTWPATMVGATFAETLGTATTPTIFIKVG